MYVDVNGDVVTQTETQMLEGTFNVTKWSCVLRSVGFPSLSQTEETNSATCNCPARIPRSNIEPLIQSRICIHLSRTNHK